MRKGVAVTVVWGIAAAALLGVGLAGVARADVPPILNFQGILLESEGGTVADSSYELTFRVYDEPLGGVVQWEETQTVTTEHGLFNTFLGKSVPVPDSVFADAVRWLEIELVGIGAYEPRTQMGSVGYAYRVNSIDGATGGSIYGDIQLHSGLTAGDLEGKAGFVEVTDGGAIAFSTDGASGVTSFSGPASSAALDMGSTGDLSVLLPNDAVSAPEQLNEPGVAADFNDSEVHLGAARVSMTDLVTTSITTPTDGYIVVQGRTTFNSNGTAGKNVVFVQVDETAGGEESDVYHAEVGIDAHSGSGNHHMQQTVYADRIYFKPAGTYTFRLEAKPAPDNSDGSVSTMDNSFITAVFYPTSYGSVNAAVSQQEAGEFSGAVSAAGASGLGEPSYRVDLRELELRAARLRAESERAQRELLEAKLELRTDK